MNRTNVAGAGHQPITQCGFAPGTYRSIDDFIDAMVSDGAMSRTEASGMVIPEKLIAEGAGLQFRYNQIGEGTVSVFRPFAGVLVAVFDGQFLSTNALDKFPAGILHLGNKFLIRLVDEGVFHHRFGTRIIKPEAGGGIVYRFRNDGKSQITAGVGRPHRYAHLLFNLDGITNAATFLGAPTPGIFGELAIATSPEEQVIELDKGLEISQLTKQIVELNVSSTFVGGFVRSKVIELFCLLGKMSDPRGPNLVSDLTYREVRLIQNAQHLIDTKFNGDITTAEIAKEIGMSRRRFSNGFRKLVGVNPSEYCKSTRLQIAYERVLQTGSPITEIAFDAGYSHISSFTRAFTKKYNKSPRAARAELL